MRVYDERRIDSAKAIILRQGHKRFGSPDDDTIAAVWAMEDMERLEELLFDRLLDGNTNCWQELLKE